MMTNVGRALSPSLVSCGLLILSCTPAVAQTAASARRSYADVVNLFRTGHEQEALEAVAVLSHSDLDAGRDALLKAFDVIRTDRRAEADLRAAAMLHAERAFSMLAAHNGVEFRYQMDLALTYVRNLALRDRKATFVERWLLYSIARLHVLWDVTGARATCRSAHVMIGDTPELLLACGATEEMAWSLERESEGIPRIKGDLKDAELRFRGALSLNPDLVEARLRLGRVLTLRGDPEGIKTLEVIVPGKDDGFSYLARLFEGDALERSGDVAKAERRYLAAIALLPTAQSAYIALAHLRHAGGARREAAADVAVLARDRTLPDMSEPWFWYARGAAWRASGYLEELRTIIRR